MSTERFSITDRFIGFFLENKLVVVILLLFLALWGIIVAPFDWSLAGLPRAPIAVDAIPDIGENQQIVFTAWEGRSPQDIEDQITYPLTTALMGVPGVRVVRSFSMYGFSTIYLIFEEKVDFYWSRARILEKLNSLPTNLLPVEVKPTLGPDATALGQVFWYTLEGRTEAGEPVGGWDLQELRTLQDWYVRYAFQSVPGVSEVASVGGFVKEYQIDVDPDALRAYGVTLAQVFAAVQRANKDVGARTIEVNQVEYIIRGIGFVKQLADLEYAVITAHAGTPIYVKQVATVTAGPAMRRGALDKDGAEAVGGVVVVRYGENPLRTLVLLKNKIKEISPSMPSKMLADGRKSKVTIVPFYDRSGLIWETLYTLRVALKQEILVTIIVLLVLLMHMRSAFLVSTMLPLTVLGCFIAMKMAHVDANIVALSGIAIAIGTIVDMGIVICENILSHLRSNEGKEEVSAQQCVYQATREVGGAVLTAVATTVISFLPVFTMQGAEGKLFRPLAYTKTFALLGAIFISLAFLPTLAQWLFASRWRSNTGKYFFYILLALVGVYLILFFHWWVGALLLLVILWRIFGHHFPLFFHTSIHFLLTGLIVLIVLLLFSNDWLPLGPEGGWGRNALFTGMLLGLLLGAILVFQRLYGTILSCCLDHKILFLSLPISLVLFGACIWLGFDTVFVWLPDSLRVSRPVQIATSLFPGLGREFMPPLDEGAFLLMPTTMPHAALSEVGNVISKQDQAISALPEVASAVGKLGRAETPLDPAPVSMIETLIQYHPEFLENEKGAPLTFRWEADKEDYFRDRDGTPIAAADGKAYRVRGRFARDNQDALIPSKNGKPFRLWRPHLEPALNPGRDAWPGIQKVEDIWREITKAASIPGTTGAPYLQPIAARLVMLQSGMRAPMGVKIKGKTLEDIETAALAIEHHLRQIPEVAPDTVNADRIIGKPYLEIHIDRQAIARYGIQLEDVQDVLEVALGGRRITSTVEGRERYPVRVRYLRELRDSIESLDDVLVATSAGAQIPLRQLAEIKYVRGPQVIKSEDAFLLGYVLFDKKPGYAEVDTVESCRRHLAQMIKQKKPVLPNGVHFTFAGNYENQLRAQKRLRIVLPLALVLIFFLLYFHFHSVATALMVFSGIAVAWSGGFILIWLFGQPWFLNFSLMGTDLQALFQIHPLNLSAAIWVGFLALFGIATDDGVIMATYIRQSLDKQQPQDISGIRHAIVKAGKRRVRPCLMTTATTVLALIPVLTATGRGADIMAPMAIPTFGGMLIALITMFLVPTLYAAYAEHYLTHQEKQGTVTQNTT